MEMGNTEAAKTNLQQAQQLFISQGNTAGTEQVANYLQQINTETTVAQSETSNSEAVSINPNDAQTHYDRGNLYLNQGKIDLALADYNQTLEIDPNFALGYYNRGLVYQQQGQRDLAEADYRKALQLDPNLTKASQSLDSL